MTTDDIYIQYIYICINCIYIDIHIDIHIQTNIYTVYICIHKYIHIYVFTVYVYKSFFSVSFDNGSKVSVSTSGFLLAKYRGNTKGYICSDSWNKSLSDTVCGLMGFG